MYTSPQISTIVTYFSFNLYRLPANVYYIRCSQWYTSSYSYKLSISERLWKNIPTSVFSNWANEICQFFKLIFLSLNLCKDLLPVYILQTIFYSYIIATQYSVFLPWKFICRLSDFEMIDEQNGKRCGRGIIYCVGKDEKKIDCDARLAFKK